MFKIIDLEKLFIPVKSGFPTTAKALDWAKRIYLKIVVDLGRYLISIKNILFKNIKGALISKGDKINESKN